MKIWIFGYVYCLNINLSTRIIVKLGITHSERVALQILMECKVLLSPSYISYLVLNCYEERQNLKNFLRKQGIKSVFHYLFLHISKMGRIFLRQGRTMPNIREYDRLLRLPLHRNLSEDQL